MKMVEVPQSFGYTILLTREKEYGRIMSFNDQSWSVMDVALGKSFHLGKGLVILAKARLLFSSFAARSYSFTTRILTPLHSILPLTGFLVLSSLATQPPPQSLLSGAQG